MASRIISVIFLRHINQLCGCFLKTQSFFAVALLTCSATVFAQTDDASEQQVDTAVADEFLVDEYGTDDDFGSESYGDESGFDTFGQSQAVTYEDNDPFETLNRAMFEFNDVADRYVLLPIVHGYKYVTPDPMERGVDNFFNNLDHISNTVNAIFQLKFKDAGIYAGSFLANSTVGVLGIFDAANALGFPRLGGEDFGQTMGYYGVPSGPYIMLPIYGPSSMRDAPGRLVDGTYDYKDFVRPIRTRNQMYFLEGISTRSQLIEAEAFITGDRYSFIRQAYLQQREYLVNDGVYDDEVEFDDFGGDWGEDDEY